MANTSRAQTTFGKAISGGAIIKLDEMQRVQVDQLAALKARVPPPLEKTKDLVSLRVSEELDYARRVLENVEIELNKRGVGGSVVAQVEATEQTLSDLSNIVDAKDRCAGIDRVEAPGLKRRLLRRDVDGSSSICGHYLPGNVPDFAATLSSHSAPCESEMESSTAVL